MRFHSIFLGFLSTIYCVTCCSPYNPKIGSLGITHFQLLTGDNHSNSGLVTIQKFWDLDEYYCKIIDLSTGNLSNVVNCSYYSNHIKAYSEPDIDPTKTKVISMIHDCIDKIKINLTRNGQRIEIEYMLNKLKCDDPKNHNKWRAINDIGYFTVNKYDGNNITTTFIFHEYYFDTVIVVQFDDYDNNTYTLYKGVKNGINNSLRTWHYHQYKNESIAVMYENIKVVGLLNVDTCYNLYSLNKYELLPPKTEQDEYIVILKELDATHSTLDFNDKWITNFVRFENYIFVWDVMEYNMYGKRYQVIPDELNWKYKDVDEIIIDEYETISAKNELENDIYSLRDRLEDDDDELGARISDDIKETLFEEIHDALDWLDDADDDRENYKEKKQEFDDIIQSILKDEL